MSERTEISWTDSTFNYWEGCTKVSPACDNCYAERERAHRYKTVEWGPGKPRRLTSQKNRNLPLRWNRNAVLFVECADCGWRGDAPGDICGACKGMNFIEARRRVFSSSLSDWLDNEVPIEWLVGLLDVIRQTPNLDWLLLTKRIGNWRGRLLAARASVEFQATGKLMDGLRAMALRDWISAWMDGSPPANVWMMATVENQKRADEDIPKLRRVPAVVRGLSIEPMLGPIDIRPWLYDAEGRNPNRPNWVICGGESGTNARPLHPVWASSLRDQCVAAGVAFHHKQNGEWMPIEREQWGADSEVERWLNEDGTREAFGNHRAVLRMRKVGKKAAGRMLDGRTWDEFPRRAA